MIYFLAELTYIGYAVMPGDIMAVRTSAGRPAELVVAVVLAAIQQNTA